MSDNVIVLRPRRRRSLGRGKVTVACSASGITVDHLSRSGDSAARLESFCLADFGQAVIFALNAALSLASNLQIIFDDGDDE